MRRLLWILVCLLGLAACSSSTITDFETLPAGHSEDGAVLFNQRINGAPACSSCHLLTDRRLIGPGFAGFNERAVTRVEGQSAEVYTFNSITQPGAYVITGYGNAMYQQYGKNLNAQQLADIIAYVLSLD